MPGVLEWFMKLTLFGRLQHSTVSQHFSSVLDLASPSISLVLQSKVKSRRRLYNVHPAVTSLNSLTAQAEFAANWAQIPVYF